MAAFRGRGARKGHLPPCNIKLAQQISFVVKYLSENAPEVISESIKKNMAMLRPIIYSSASTPMTPDSSTKIFDLTHYPALEKLDSGTRKEKNKPHPISCIYITIS